MGDISLPCQVYLRVRTSESQGLFFVAKNSSGEFLELMPELVFLTARKLKTNK